MKRYIIIFTLFLCGISAAAQNISEITLEHCVQDALAYSNYLKSLKAKADGARAQYKSAASNYYPSLNLEANGGWVSQVPTIKFGGQSLEFGDNWNYSAGVGAEYLLLDFGKRSGSVDAARSAADSAAQEYAFAAKTVTLDTRRAYFTVQQDLENMFLAAEQLKVAQKQLKDVQAGYKAGAKSRLDVSLAQKQELRAMVNISAARGALGGHLRALFQLTGQDYGINPLYPADWRVTLPKQDKPATAVIKADGLETTLKTFAPFAKYNFDAASAKLAALESMAEYYDNLAKSFKGDLYPNLAISGGAYYEYPNGPIRENVFLGRAGAAFKMPLFEAGKSRNNAKAQQENAQNARYQKLDLKDSLEQLFYSSQGYLYALDLQAGLTRQMITAAAQAAALTYDAYNAGSVTFLDVDNANLSLLESRISLAGVYIETLNRLAVLDNLGAGN